MSESKPRPQLYTRKVSVAFVEEAAQQLEGELLAQMSSKEEEDEQQQHNTEQDKHAALLQLMEREVWEEQHSPSIASNSSNNNNSNSKRETYSSAIRRISHHIQEANRNRRSSTSTSQTPGEDGMLGDGDLEGVSQRRRAVVTFIPHIVAYKGDMPKMRELIAQHPDKEFFKVGFDYTPGRSLLTKEEEDDDLYIPPPQLPKLIRTALKIQNVNNMTRDQRWLLQHAFPKSTILHYACAADHYEMVEYLIAEGMNINLVNGVGKPAEYYTFSNDIRELLWSRGHEQEDAQQKIRSTRKASQHAEKLKQNIRKSILDQQTPFSQNQLSELDGQKTEMMEVLKRTAPPVPNSRPLPKAPQDVNLSTMVESNRGKDPRRPSIVSDQSEVPSVASDAGNRRISSKRMSRVLGSRRYSDASVASDSSEVVQAPPVVHKKLSVLEMHKSRRGSVNQPIKPPARPNKSKEVNLEDFEVDVKSSSPTTNEPIRQEQSPVQHRKSVARERVSSGDRVVPPPLSPPPLPTSPLPIVSTPDYPPPPPPPQKASSAGVASKPIPPPPVIVESNSVKFVEPPANDLPITELYLPPPSSRPIVTRRLSVAGDSMKSVTLVEKEGQIEVMKEPKKALTKSARRASMKAMQFRKSMLFDKKIFNEKGERIMATRKAKFGKYVPPPKELVEEQKMNRMKDFLSNFVSLEEVAGKVLAENSNNQESDCGNLYNKVAHDERNLTFSAARSATTLSLLYENMDVLIPASKKTEPTTLSFREMLWRKSGSRMNDGLYDGPTMRMKKLRTQAYEDGLKALKKEFKSYADRDDWEAVELLQQNAMKALDSLRFDSDLYLEDASIN